MYQEIKNFVNAFYPYYPKNIMYRQMLSPFEKGG